MLSRVLTFVVFIPLAILLVALAVANRAPVAFTIDPFNPGNPALTATMPLFVYLFGALILGLAIGSLATWFKQGRYRKIAKRQLDRDHPPREADSGSGRALTAPRA